MAHKMGNKKEFKNYCGHIKMIATIFFKELIHMKLKQFIELLQDEDLELDVLFDVKSFGQVDFGHLVDLYSDGEALILEFK